MRVPRVVTLIIVAFLGDILLVTKALITGITGQNGSCLSEWEKFK